MKVIKIVALICFTSVFFSCSKTSETKNDGQAKILAEKKLTNDLNMLSSQYASDPTHQHRLLGTWSGLGVDIMSGVSGAEWGAAAGPVGSFCLGLSFGICGSAWAMYTDSSYIDPCTGQTVYVAYQPNGHLNLDNVSQTSYYKLYTSLTQLSGNGNPYDNFGLAHDIALNQIHCNGTLLSQIMNGNQLTVFDSVV